MYSSSRSSPRSNFERLPTRGIGQHKHARIKPASRTVFPGSAWRRLVSGLLFKHRPWRIGRVDPSAMSNTTRRDAPPSVELQRHTRDLRTFVGHLQNGRVTTWYSPPFSPQSARRLQQYIGLVVRPRITTFRRAHAALGPFCGAPPLLTSGPTKARSYREALRTAQPSRPHWQRYGARM